MIRLVIPWDCLAQANHRLIPRAMKVNGKWVGRQVPNPDYYEPKKRFELRALSQMLQQKGKKLAGPCAVNMIFYEPDMRRRDPSNYQKMIEDGMTDIVYLDDKQIHDCHWSRGGVDRSNPRVDITIREMKGAFD